MAAQQREEGVIFNEARQLKSPQERSRYLEDACGDDIRLKNRIVDLLRVHEENPTFLDPKTTEIRKVFETVLGLGPDTLIGPYHLLHSIGEGGMGAVYLAEQQEPVQRRVAIKVIRPGMDTEQVLARFEAERQALALLDHPNIAKVLDAGTTQANRPYFVMELIAGMSITRYCDEQRLSLVGRLELFVQVCHGVQHAHQKGIIHRDLKPSNILVTTYDDKPAPKIIDFGIAKATGFKLTDQSLVTEFGSVVGTLEYMSPEQAEPGQADIDTRSDIYSLGVLLYELLTGNTPLQPQRFQGAALLDLLRLVREEGPPKPSTRLSSIERLPTIAMNRGVEPRRMMKFVRGELDWITMKCLEKDRTRRYATANALVRDIERHLNGEPVEAGPPSRSYRLRKFVYKNRRLLSAVGTFVLLLGVGIAISTWQAVRATGAEGRALEALAKEETQRKVAEQSMRESATVLKFFRERVLAAARPKNEGGGLGKDATVREALDKAEPEIAKTFADQPIVEASIRHALAQNYSQMGATGFGIRQEERALALFREHRGLEHPDTLSAMNNLAIMFISDGQTDAAQRMFAAVADSYKRVYGPEDPATLRSRNNLANVLQSKDELDEARKILEEILPIQRRVQSPESPDTVRTINNLAIVLQKQGHLEEARKLYEEAVEIQLQSPGPEHRQTVSTMGNLAVILHDLGHYEKARRIYEKVIASLKGILPENHPHILFFMSNLAHLMQEQGDYRESRKLGEETLQLQRETLSKGHPDTIRTMLNLAWLQATASDLSVRDPQRALSLSKEAVELAPAAGTKWTTLGVAFYRAGDSKNAISSLKKYENEMPGRYISITAFFLAMAHSQLGEKEIARKEFEKAVEWMEKNKIQDEELQRFRIEASQLLDLPNAASTPKDDKK